MDYNGDPRYRERHDSERTERKGRQVARAWYGLPEGLTDQEMDRIILEREIVKPNFRGTCGPHERNIREIGALSDLYESLSSHWRAAQHLPVSIRASSHR